MLNLPSRRYLAEAALRPTLQMTTQLPIAILQPVEVEVVAPSAVTKASQGLFNN